MLKGQKYLKRRFFLFSSALAVIKILSQVNKPSQAFELQEEIPATSDSYFLENYSAAKGITYGAFGGKKKNFFDDTEFQSLFFRECSLLTVGFYWSRTRPSSSTFNFSSTDAFAQITRDNAILFRGHPLVWHQSNPQWLIEKFAESNTTFYEIENILTQHISTVVKRYSGQVHSWDVVNEAIAPHEDRSDNLRITPWLEFLGPDYIDLAFRVAAQADPQAMLVYNDNSLDYDIPKDEAKRDAVLKLLYRLKAMGTPIHALGIQAHLRVKETRFSPEKLRDFLRHVGSLDLKIMITELDVSDQGLPKDINERDRLVAQHYYDYLTVILDEPAVIGVITWGLSDRYTWLSNHRPRSDGLPVRPLPLDRDLNRKPAWYAIAKAFDNAPNRTFFD